jgi:hypothetical protein
MKFSKVQTILIIATLLFGGVVFLSVSSPASAQTAQPTSTLTPIPPPDLTISAVQATLTVQQTDLVNLKDRLNIETGYRELLAKDMEWKWWLGGALVGSIVTILSWLGINSVVSGKKAIEKAEKNFEKYVKDTEERWEKHIADLEFKWETQSERNLNKLLEKFDLTNLPIYIPTETGDVRRRLELSGLEYKEYQNFREVINLAGIIVVKFDESMDQKAFRDLIAINRPNSQKTAIVIYSRLVEDETRDCFENLVIGNFPATVVSNILAVGRGLEIDDIEKEDA